MEWQVTPHALEQMAERGIARDQLDRVLARPQTTLPDPKRQPGCRIFQSDQVVAFVNEDEHVVITVGIHGASRDDWHTFAAPQGGPAPAEPVTYGVRRRRAKDKGLPVTKSNILDGVHEHVAAEVCKALAQRGLDFRAIRVISPTEVEIVLPEETRCQNPLR
jgi:hypothetical protein